MLDPMSVYVLTRQRHAELLREAAADRRADEALASGSTPRPMWLRPPVWRQSVLAWAPCLGGADAGCEPRVSLRSIIERFRIGTRLESPGG